MSQEESMRILDCLELLGIPWEYQGVDSNQNVLDEETGVIQVIARRFLKLKLKSSY